MFQHILCPIDFSVASYRALEHAIGWAERSRGTLELLHVLEPPAIARGEVWSMYLDLEQPLVRQLELKMARAVEGARHRIASVEGRVVVGSRAKEIAERADASDVDLVVIGRAREDVPLRVGSTVSRLLRSTGAPLLVVSPRGRAVSIPPRTFIVTTDFSMASKVGVTRSIVLAKELDATVEVVHAFEMAGSEDARHVAIALRTALTTEMRQQHADLEQTDKIRARAHEGPTSPTILALADEIHADLIAIPSRGRNLISRSFFGSVAEDVIRRSEVPVLVWRLQPRAT